jgi:hypothetical protein
LVVNNKGMQEQQVKGKIKEKNRETKLKGTDTCCRDTCCTPEIPTFLKWQEYTYVYTTVYPYIGGLVIDIEGKVNKEIICLQI